MQDGNLKNKSSNTSYDSKGNSFDKEGRETVKEFLEMNTFNSDWILKGADVSMNSFAEKAGKYMAPKGDRDKNMLSKSQIRNVYGEIKRIQFKGIEKVDGKSSFILLKAKVAYAEGRNKTKGLSLFKKIFDLGWKEVAEGEVTKEKYLNFCNLLEAVLAYHKAYGGKD